MARANLLLVLSVRAERLPVPLVLPVPLGWVRDTLRGGQVVWSALRWSGLQAAGARAVARLLPAAVRRVLAGAARAASPGGGTPGVPIQGSRGQNALPDPALLMALAIRALDSLAAAGPATLAEIRQGPTHIAIRLL